MIISDEHRFAFVHIPKNAGTSVKDSNPSLLRFQGDEPEGTYAAIKPPLVWHLPLAMLAATYPTAFAKIEAYESFAVLRDPFGRFCSAVMQHGREFKGMSSSELFGPTLVNVGQEVCDNIAQQTDYTDPVYVHFIPQVEYIYLGGRQIVKNLDTGDFRHLNAFFAAHSLQSIPVETRSNVSMLPSSWAAASILRAARPVYKAVLPAGFKDRLWGLMIKAGVFKPAGARYGALHKDKRIKEFVQNYYRADFKLFGEISQTLSRDIR